MAPDVELANIITNEPLARYIDIDEKPLASSSENSSSHVRFTPEDSELGETSATRSLLEFTPVDEDEVVLTEKEWMRDNEQEDAPLESPYLASQRRRRRRRRSSQTHRFFFTFTAEEERVVVKKLDRRIVFFVSLLYMLSFLDRSNIGNARIAGLDADLALSTDQFEWLLQAFYMTYIAFEWLSVLWRIIPAHVYISLIVLSWGLIASLQSVQTSFTGMLIMRILLGIGEAGFTGIPIYLSFFFKRSELALRTGYFLSAAPLATSFASSLAWAIMKLDALIPIAPWRLLFIVEGFPAIFIALLAFRIIPDTPAHATFLNVRQRKIACLRLQQGVPSSCAPVASPATLSARDLIATLRDPKNYLTALMLCLTNISLASMPVFLPTIIHSMGHTSTLSQALSAPPYLVTFCIVLLTARLSDRHRSRGKYIIFHSLLSSTGYIAVALVGACGWSSWLRYACLFPAVAGFFSVITLILTWSINNAESEARKGWAFAMMQIVGQCGPLLGTRIYPKKDGPLYLRGMLGCAGAMLGVAAAAAYLMTHLKQRNQKLDESEHDARRVPANQNDHDGEDVELISHGRQLKSDETRFRYIL